MLNQKGFATIVTLIIVVAVLSAGGLFLLKSKTAVAPTESALPSVSPTPTPGAICTQDAKLCPDGSYVGRTGPKCEFKPCPAVKTSVYTNNSYNFTVRYPATWQIKEEAGSVVFYQLPIEHKNEIYLVLENNPKMLSTTEWLTLIGIDTRGSAVVQLNGLSGIKTVEKTPLAAIHVYTALKDKVVHFFVEQNTDFPEVFTSIYSSFTVSK